jgi:hypothetical protein
MKMPIGALIMMDADGNEQKLGDCIGEIEATPIVHENMPKIQKECSFTMKIKTSPGLKLMFKKAKIEFKIIELTHIMHRTRKLRVKRKLLHRILKLREGR